MAKKVPMRRCVGCNTMKNKKEMIRILKSSEDNIFLDVTGRGNGRGAYLCLNDDCFIKARKSKGFERSFKMRIGDEIYGRLAEELNAVKKDI